MASSRSIALPVSVMSTTRCTGTSRSSWFLICSITIGVPVVTMVMQREMLGVLGLRHRQRLDIVAAAGEQADDARQHARLVVDQHRERMRLRLLRRRRGRIMAGRGSVHDILSLTSARLRMRSRGLDRAPARDRSTAWRAPPTSRALRKGPASTTSKPSWPTRSITFGLFAASSPATNITDFTPLKTGFAILPKPVVLSVLNTEAPTAQPCTFSPPEMLWPISSADAVRPARQRVGGVENDLALDGRPWRGWPLPPPATASTIR